MIKTTLAALATTAILASGASAATINFSSNGTGAAGDVAGGPLSYTTSATWTVPLLGTLAGVVTVSADGLGVDHFGDTQGGQIDGTPRFTAETLTVTFSWAVKLVDLTLGRFDGNDDYELSINNGAFNSYATAGLTLNQNYVTSFSIRASGLGSIAKDGLLGNDDFTLAAANVSAVPLPAGAPLLLAGLAGLAALRRRKAA